MRNRKASGLSLLGEDLLERGLLVSFNPRAHRLAHPRNVDLIEWQPTLVGECLHERQPRGVDQADAV
jgi:hypothetical protein